MHTITHVVEPSRLLLVWQDPYGQSRQRLVVGQLWRGNDDQVKFQYFPSSDDFKTARELGFQGYPSFGRFNDLYEDGVLDAFLRRIPPRKRVDFKKYLETLRLPQDQEISDFALLGYSGAKLPGDGFSLVHPFENVRHDCELLLEVAGFRHQSQIPIEDLSIGDAATFIPDPENPVDPRAVKIQVRGHKVGYVNRVQVDAIQLWLEEMSVHAWVERLNGRPERPLVYLFVEVRALQAPSIALG